MKERKNGGFYLGLALCALVGLTQACRRDQTGESGPDGSPTRVSESGYGSPASPGSAAQGTGLIAGTAGGPDQSAGTPLTAGTASEGGTGASNPVGTPSGTASPGGTGQ